MLVCLSKWAQSGVNKASATCLSAVQKVSWEEQVPHAALKEGGVLLADEEPAFAMHWASAEQFWQVASHSSKQGSLCWVSSWLTIAVYDALP